MIYLKCYDNQPIKKKKINMRISMEVTVLQNEVEYSDVTINKIIEVMDRIEKEKQELIKPA